jgi:hypothetical protein
MKAAVILTGIIVASAPVVAQNPLRAPLARDAAHAEFRYDEGERFSEVLEALTDSPLQPPF